jgi:two-component system, chemotaxis family, response regulator Rcp1
VNRYVARPVELLLIEDNVLDAEMLGLLLSRMSVPIRMHHVTDGDQALRFARRRPPFETAPPPDLILLDIHLPGLSGIEVLQIFKEDDELRHTPILMLTGSSSWLDVQEAYEKHANGYLVKPVRQGDARRVFEALSAFWFSIVTLPPEPGRLPALADMPVSPVHSDGCDVSILCVEDEPLDAEALIAMARELKFTGRLDVVPDGEAALAALQTHGFRPDVILLDLRLPGDSGDLILKAVKQDARWHGIQVVAFSHIDHDPTVLELYRERVNAFIRKPENEIERRRVLTAIAHWYSVVTISG